MNPRIVARPPRTVQTFKKIQGLSWASTTSILKGTHGNSEPTSWQTGTWRSKVPSYGACMACTKASQRGPLGIDAASGYPTSCSAKWLLRRLCCRGSRQSLCRRRPVRGWTRSLRKIQKQIWMQIENAGKKQKRRSPKHMHMLHLYAYMNMHRCTNANVHANAPMHMHIGAMGALTYAYENTFTYTCI